MHERDDNLSWSEMYALWNDCCIRYEVAPRLHPVPVFTFHEQVDLFANYSWAKIGATYKELAPRARAYKGFHYLDSHSPKPSIDTAKLLDENASDEERFACACLASGLFQLHQENPSHWQCSTAQELLYTMFQTCLAQLGYSERFTYWSRFAKYVFPEKFFLSITARNHLMAHWTTTR